MALNGSCHCGAVRFAVSSPINELTQCDCSLCVKRNAVMARAPLAALEVTSGREMLTLYQWNTKKAQHYFCSACGIYVFHKKRSAPDFYCVNVFCLDGFDSTGLPITPADGATMTVEDQSLRDDLPGPRV